MNREQLIIEVTKCMRNTPYALRTYLQTYDNTVSKYVPLDLFPDQVSLIEDYDNFNENITSSDTNRLLSGAAFAASVYGLKSVMSKIKKTLKKD